MAVEVNLPEVQFVQLSGVYKIKNWVTGESTEAYTITQLPGGIIRIEDLRDQESGVEWESGVREFYGVEQISFSDGQRLLVDVQTSSWSWTHTEYNDDFTTTDYDVRQYNHEGGVFDDVIEGSEQSDRMEGGSGNDALLGDGMSEQASTFIGVAGGSSWSAQKIDGEGVGTGIALPVTDVNGAIVFFDGQSYADSGFTQRNVSGEIKIVSSSPSALVGVDFGSTAESLRTAIDGISADVQLYIEVSNEQGDAGRLILDVFTPTSIQARDEISGGEGNDYIDGGYHTDLDWGGDEARYEGESSDYIVSQVAIHENGLTATTSMVDGSTVAAFAESIGQEAANMQELLQALQINTAFISNGDTYTFVADTQPGRDGVDLVTNVETLGFSDGPLNLAVQKREMSWRDGKDYEGSILGDEILADDGGDDVDYNDYINGNRGNDFILARDGGDQVNAGQGNDYADAGASGDSGNSWEDNDVFELSGAASRYTVESATQADVEGFWEDNFGDLTHLGADAQYDATKKYYLVTDTSPLLGSGTDLITGFDELRFSDETVRLEADIYTYHYQWDDSYSISVNDTAFDDVVDAQVEADAQNAEDGATFSSNAIFGDGNDQYFGLVDGEDSVELGAGNDLFVGNGVGEGAYSWSMPADRVSFQGREARYEIQKVAAGDSVTVQGVDVDLSNLNVGEGVVTFDGQAITVGLHDDAIVVADRLPEEFGGQGVDLLIGATRISFTSGYDIDLEPRINVYEGWSGSNTAYIEASQFGGVIDLSQGAEGSSYNWETDSNDTITATSGNIRGGDGDDVVIGFAGQNSVEASKGNDVFIANVDTGETGETAYQNRDTANYFDDDAGHFAFSKVYLEVDLATGAVTRADDGSYAEFSDAADGRLLFTKVEDTRDTGKGADYYHGFEQIQFANGATVSDTVTTDVVSSEMGYGETLDSLQIDEGQTAVSRVGSEFSDRIEGRDVPSFLSADLTTAGYVSAALTNLETAAVAQAMGGADELVLFSVDGTNGELTPERFVDTNPFTGDGLSLALNIWVIGDESTQQQLNAALETARASASGGNLDMDGLQTALEPFLGGGDDSANGGDFGSGGDFGFDDPTGMGGTDFPRDMGGFDPITGMPIDGESSASDEPASDDPRYPESAIFVATLNGTQLVAPINADMFNSLNTFVDQGRDEIEGGSGDDLLLGMGGADTLDGGEGNDVLDGGSDMASGATSAEDLWHLVDEARYEGVESQYTISRIFVQRDAEGYVTAESQTQAEGMVEAYVVQDTLPDAFGGAGRDILIDVERIHFEGSDTDKWLIDPPARTTNGHEQAQFSLTDAAVHFNAQTDSNVQAAVTDQIDSVEALITSDLLSSASTSVMGLRGSYDASATLDPHWMQMDRVRFEADRDAFTVSSTFVALDDEGDFVLSGDNVALFAEGATVAEGTLNQAVLLTHSGGAQFAILDFGEVNFADGVYLSVGSRYVAEGQNEGVEVTWDQGAGSGNNFIDTYLQGRIELGQYGGTTSLSGQALVDFVSSIEATQSNVDMVSLHVVDGAGDNVIKLHSSNFQHVVDLKGGDDFVHFTANDDVADFAADDNEVNLEGPSTRFSVRSVYIQLDDAGLPVEQDDGSVRFVQSNTAGAVEAIVVQDTISPNLSAYLGSKVVVGADRIQFSDGVIVETGGEIETSRDDWNMDGAPEMIVMRGSNLGELLQAAEADLGFRHRLEGQRGDDTLVGGNNGDELVGGAGNDLLVGLGDGDSGYSWEDQDRASMWSIGTDDLDVSAVVLGYNATTHELIRDDNGNVLTTAQASDLRDGFELTQAVQVTDLTGVNGTDWLIGVEVISTRDGEIQTSAGIEAFDWDNDGVPDYVDVRGTDFGDLISNSLGADAQVALSQDNWINTGAGDDTVYSGAGGDDITLGSGVDFVDAGADGVANEWGWVSRDTVRFEGNLDRYNLESESFRGVAVDLENREGDVVFQIDGDGNLSRAGSGQTLYTFATGDNFIVVEDQMPNLSFLDSDGYNLIVNAENLSFADDWVSAAVERNIGYDEDGNATYGWMSGTLANDFILGSTADDWMTGGAGDDILVGLEGSDSLRGGAGHDTLYGDLRDSRSPLEGTDTAQYDGVQDQYTITKRVGEVAGETLAYIEVVDLIGVDEDGNNFTDILVGIEAISFSDAYVNVGVEQWRDFNEDGSLRSVSFTGSDFADQIDGSFAGDWIRDGAGDDVVYGNQGADQFDVGEGNDTLYGGAEGLTPWGTEGVDTARFEGSSDNYEVTYFDATGANVLTYDAEGYVSVRDTEGDYGDNTLFGIERIEFSDKTLSLGGLNSGNRVQGDDGDNVLNETPWNPGSDFRIEGFGGDDTLYGHGGNDVLEGGVGDDTLSGGNGLDVAVFAGDYSEFSVVRGDGSVTVTHTPPSGEEDLGTDTLTGVEQLRFDDTVVNLSEGIFVRDLDRDGDFETAVFVADFDGSTMTDTTFRANEDLQGVALDNPLHYIISGGQGNDSFTTAGGDDEVRFSAGSDVISLGEGLDTVLVDADYDSTWTITGTSLAQGSDSSTLSGVELIQFANRVISLQNQTEIMDGQGAFYANFAGATFDASSEDNSVSWELFGGEGSDTLTGSQNDDILHAGGGSDSLDGGDGADTAVFVGDREDYTISQSDGTWTVADNSNNTATLNNIESLRFDDGIERLTVENVEFNSYEFGQGVVTGIDVYGTDFGEEIQATGQVDDENVAVNVSGGLEDDDAESADTFVVNLEELMNTNILDFEGLAEDDDGSDVAKDMLRFTGAGDDITSVEDLLEFATADAEANTVTFDFNGNQLVLQGLTLEDLSSDNIQLGSDLV